MNSQDALLCAKASKVVYDGKNASQILMASLGYTDSFTWIKLDKIFDEVCAFTVSSAKDNTTLLCFRGTSDPKDWMTDLACTPVRYDWIFTGGPQIGEIHAGFGHCLSDGLKTIIKALGAPDSGRRLLVTGHSLGGALGALAASCFSVYSPALRPVDAVYTFGQPRIGLHEFCNTYDRILKGKLVRFVNKKDLVPRVPFRGWDYSDEGKMIHFDDNGNPVVESAQWTNFLARTLEGIKGFMEMISHLGADVGDHSMEGYEALVEKRQGDIQPLIS